MLTDPIADFLTRIRNASAARRRDLSLPASRMIKSITKVLVAKRFVESFEEQEGNEMRITLRTDRPALEIRRVSKPGQRIYLGFDQIHPVKNGLGMAVISTSQGIMSGEEAREKKIGGEYICEIY